MYSKIVKNLKFENYSKERVKITTDCKVSLASIEIMLHRFCNGKEIDFPFHNN